MNIYGIFVNVRGKGANVHFTPEQIMVIAFQIGNLFSHHKGSKLTAIWQLLTCLKSEKSKHYPGFSVVRDANLLWGGGWGKSPIFLSP